MGQLLYYLFQCKPYCYFYSEHFFYNLRRKNNLQGRFYKNRHQNNQPLVIKNIDNFFNNLLKLCRNLCVCVCVCVCETVDRHFIANIQMIIYKLNLFINNT